ncbi:MAG: nitroreductase [Candidatus Heimdallarchaeota archaeon]|nr:nitroreductase [Candidatus Heimdallarchaeota archaeon]
MTLTETIHARRAYRSLKPTKITEKLLEDISTHAILAASCMNNQPARFIFVFDPTVLKDLISTLTRGNQVWAKRASLIVAVFSKADLDCQIKEREYYLFDTGMATAHLILRLTELGLVAHPIAGYDPEKAKQVLNLSDDFNLITLVIVGKKADTIPEDFSEGQKKAEIVRPKRKELSEFTFYNKYNEGISS